MSYFINKHRLFTRAIAGVVVCLFLLNSMLYAAEPLGRDIPKSTLAPATKIPDSVFQEEFAVGNFLLTLSEVRGSISEQVAKEKAWGELLKQNA